MLYTILLTYFSYIELLLNSLRVLFVYHYQLLFDQQLAFVHFSHHNYAEFYKIAVFVCHTLADQLQL